MRPASHLPREAERYEVGLDGRSVTLTNLGKPFWPELGVTKGDLLRILQEKQPAALESRARGGHVI